MGFSFGRLGSKISGGLGSAARIGKKVLGTTQRIGNKIADTGEKIVGGVEKVPILGNALKNQTAIARKGIGLVRHVAQTAGEGVTLIEKVEDLVKEGRKVDSLDDAVKFAKDVRKAGVLAKSKLEAVRNETRSQADVFRGRAG